MIIYIMEKYICKYCGKKFANKSSVIRHENKCLKNPNLPKDYIRYKTNQMSDDEMMIYKNELKTFECICKTCNNQYTITITQLQYDTQDYNHYCCILCRNKHIVTEETKQKISKNLKSNPNHYTRPYKTYYCKQCGKPFTMKDERDVTGNLYCSAECKHKYLSAHTGGKRCGSGRGKRGWYKGIYCDSSWELAFVIYHLDNNLHIERCSEKRKYQYKDKIHTYYPDFITDAGIIEIKGYRTELWDAKEQQNPDIKVLYKDDIKMYIDYVVLKYGCDFITMYEDLEDIYNPKEHTKAWVHNDTELLFINTKDYDYYINNGWVHGRLTKTVTINKDGIYKVVNINDAADYYQKGWVKGGKTLNHKKDLTDDDRYNVYGYDIINDSYLIARNINDMSKKINIKLRNNVIKYMLVAGQYLFSRSEQELLQKIMKYNNQLNEPRYNSGLFVCLMTDEMKQDILNGMYYKQFMEKYNVCKATYFNYKNKLLNNI